MTMHVVSVNTGERKTINWKGKSVQTGIFKYPVNEPITLGKTDVEKDSVIDRRYHGGVDKACYLFSADVYPAWRKMYPDPDWNLGMFGENITLSGLDESQIMIGDQYQIGTAVVEVSQPRQPCYKLGVRFNDQRVLKDFIRMGHSGVYVRVLLVGEVTSGDEMKLIKKGSDLTVLDVFKLLYKRHDNPELVEQALTENKLAESAKAGLVSSP